MEGNIAEKQSQLSRDMRDTRAKVEWLEGNVSRLEGLKPKTVCWKARK